MLFKITNGAVSFGADTILERIDFEIHDREKIAVVGRNGSGKTTLLRAVAGEVPLEEGTGDAPFSVTVADCPVIGYLKQIAFPDEERTLIEEILTVFSPLIEMEQRMQDLLTQMETRTDDKVVSAYSTLQERYENAGGYTYQKEYSAMLKQFGFSEADRTKRLKEFSGGQRTKIAFAKLLLSHPDVLLLDEPTNHLDLGAVKWLESYVKSYKSAVVMVSHDRMFVERTVDRVYEIEYGETHAYKGNYSDFERQKRIEYERRRKDYEYRRAEIARLNVVIERFRYKATKAAMVQSKIKLVERLKAAGDAPDRYDLKTFRTHFQPKTESVKEVLTVKDLVVGYDRPLASVTLTLSRGQKLAVIGDNGVGKSTFVKTLVGEIPALSGTFSFGVRTEIGYFSQKTVEYVGDWSVKEDFWTDFPQLTETEVRTALGGFLFSGEEVDKRVCDLSGGERVRLALCKIFKRRPNVLILDEPTNHMDIVGKETLENMLCEYEGTVIVVSHDRYLVNKVADRLLVFTADGASYQTYVYAEYELRQSEKEQAEKAIKDSKTENKETQKGFSTPLKDRARKEKRLKKIEERLSFVEQEIARGEEKLKDPQVYSDYKSIIATQEEIDALKYEQEELTEEWCALSEELSGH